MKFLLSMLRLLAIIAILIMLSVILFTMGGCNAARQIEKSEQNVITHPQSLRKVGLIWQELNPCANDSTIQFIPGKTDSVYLHDIISQKELVIDSTALDSILLNNSSVCNEKIKAAFDLGLETATNGFNKMKIPVKRPDTAKYIVLDKRAWNLLDDSLQRAERHIYGLDQQGVDNRESLANSRKTANKWLWYFIGACVIGLTTNAIWIYTKIKI